MNKVRYILDRGKRFLEIDCDCGHIHIVKFSGARIYTMRCRREIKVERKRG